MALLSISRTGVSWRVKRRRGGLRAGSERRRHYRPVVELLEPRLVLSGSPPSAVYDAYVTEADTTLEVTRASSIIAETGFNDATGVNADATPGSPYQIGATVHNRGSVEPGWSHTWVVKYGAGFGGESRIKASPTSSSKGTAPCTSMAAAKERVPRGASPIKPGDFPSRLP
jgi:hypothetical protein